MEVKRRMKFEYKVREDFRTVVPDLAQAEKSRLAEDIKIRGEVVIPITVDETGAILDGHNRWEIAESVGARLPDPIIRNDLKSDEEKLCFIIQENVNRRHLSADQKRELIGKLKALAKTLREKGQTQEQVARIAGVDRASISRWESNETNVQVNNSFIDRRARLRSDDRKEILLLEKSGVPRRQIAADYKITEQWVGKIVKREGGKKKPKEEVASAGGLVRTAEEVRGKFQCIYVDPPWSYDQGKGCEGAVLDQYKTMTPDQLYNLKVCDVPVWAIAASGGAHLWMWTTWPKIRDGIPHRLLEKWGFRWVGEIVWIKPGMGVGRWTRKSTEILILAVSKGGGPKLKHKDQIDHFKTEKRMRHSQKPDKAYEIIERLSPESRIELFARRVRQGWCRWGDESPE